MSQHMRNSQTADLKTPDEFTGTCEKGDNCDCNLQTARREITEVARGDENGACYLARCVDGGG